VEFQDMQARLDQAVAKHNDLENNMDVLTGERDSLLVENARMQEAVLVSEKMIAECTQMRAELVDARSDVIRSSEFANSATRETENNSIEAQRLRAKLDLASQELGLWKGRYVAAEAEIADRKSQTESLRSMLAAEKARRTDALESMQIEQNNLSCSLADAVMGRDYFSKKSDSLEKHVARLNEEVFKQGELISLARNKLEPFATRGSSPVNSGGSGPSSIFSTLSGIAGYGYDRTCCGEYRCRAIGNSAT
jgi:chromosome segregation ATPase